MTRKILHVARCDKFIPSFIELVNKEFGEERHKFFLKSGMADNELPHASNIYLQNHVRFHKYKYLFKLIKEMHHSDRIVLHSLLDIEVVKALFLTPWLLKKCSWFIWGADLYAYKYPLKNKRSKIKEILRRQVIRNLGCLVTYLKNDYILAQKWYGAKGEYHECLMYKSNLYKEYNIKNSAKSVLNIQVGNSADPSNNHIDALKKLLPFKDENINIFVPLSYGSKVYADKVANIGREWFGDKFYPLFDFMAFNEYISFLDRIDIAIFNHQRQQAMGNTITLLGLGKTVYLQNKTSQWSLFKEKSIKVYDIDSFESLFCKQHTENIELVKQYFSIENLKKQLRRLFEA